MTYHWTLRDVLDMPAKDFFVMLRHGRELSSKKRYSFLHDLTYAIRVPHLTPQSAENVMRMFHDFSITQEEREENEAFVARVKEETDAEKVKNGQVLDAGGDLAKAAVLRVFALKRRAEYGK